MRIYKMGTDAETEIQRQTKLSIAIETQNTNFRNRVQKIETERQLNSQMSMYQLPSLDNYSFANSILSIIYICIVLILAYKLYGSTNYSKPIKVLILSSIIIYPFLIARIELTLYEYILFYYSITTGNVYKKNEM